MEKIKWGRFSSFTLKGFPVNPHMWKSIQHQDKHHNTYKFCLSSSQSMNSILHSLFFIVSPLPFHRLFILKSEINIPIDFNYFRYIYRTVTSQMQFWIRNQSESVHIRFSEIAYDTSEGKNFNSIFIFGCLIHVHVQTI